MSAGTQVTVVATPPLIPFPVTNNNSPFDRQTKVVKHLQRVGGFKVVEADQTLTWAQIEGLGIHDKDYLQLLQTAYADFKAVSTLQHSPPW